MAVEGAEDEIDDGGLGPGDGLGGIAADGRADDGEDARPDDGTDAERGQGDGAEGFLERVLWKLGVGDELVDGLGGEDLSGQGCVSSVRIYRIVMIVSGSSPGRTFCEFMTCQGADLDVPLGAELAEVMVDVFMHKDGPLVGCQAPEERVGVRGAAFGAGGGELIERFN